MADETANDGQPLLCSNCFADEGLRIDAVKHGLEQQGDCPNCKSPEGRKLMKEHIQGLAWRFFVSGTTIRCEYGAAPVIQCNEYHYGKSDISPSPWLENDIKLIENAAKIGFFHYGPRLWMVGEVEPLKALQDPVTRPQIIERVLKEYPERTVSKGTKFYRLRVSPQRRADPAEYDSPPAALAGKGRLDSSDFPVMYGSQDIDICIHECRASTEDDIYVATLKTQRDLRLLDLTQVLEEEGTEFESLDIAVHMLFLARSHSYEISRAIALAAKNVGFDGVIYPSFFSLIRTGGHPFETSYGLSLRRFHPERNKYAAEFTIQNFALFGRPLESGLVSVDCINRLILTQVGYLGHFGPVTY
ncbi:RES family NAD+ phosphorylase [Pseudomonas sp. BN102]|uniref:RES family NAD+ phosphorylase n=1 Tax=Pseudomonas sp. BN102 TaxID=2567886 RepID=UPI0024579D8A|nr:RES family NAD+ phosphorylase [Pseudomonas sp. BN102]MDH4611598.1 RES domain-containing protein [Pseudomonas sp. BN102]